MASSSAFDSSDSDSESDAISLNIVRHIIRRNQRNVSIADKLNNGGSVTNADSFDDTASVDDDFDDDSESDEFVPAPATATDSDDNDDDHHDDSSVDFTNDHQTLPRHLDTSATANTCFTNT